MTTICKWIPYVRSILDNNYLDFQDFFEQIPSRVTPQYKSTYPRELSYSATRHWCRICKVYDREVSKVEAHSYLDD